MQSVKNIKQIQVTGTGTGSTNKLKLIRLDCDVYAIMVTSNSPQQIYKRINKTYTQIHEQITMVDLGLRPPLHRFLATCS